MFDLFSLLCAAALVSIASGCGDSQAEPVSSKTSKLEVAGGADANSNGADANSNGADANSKRQPKQRIADLEIFGSPRQSGGEETKPPTSADSDGVLSDEQAKALLVEVRDLNRRFQQAAFQGQGMSRDEVVQVLKPILDEIIQKTGQIVAANTSSKTRIAAAEMKIDALKVRAGLTQQDVAAAIEQFCRTLQRDRSAPLVRLANRTLFVLDLEKSLEDENPDIAARHEELAKIVKADKDAPHELKPFLNNVMGLLGDRDRSGEASAVALVIADELQHSQDEELLQLAESYRMDGKALRLKPMIEALLEGKDGSVAALQQWIHGELSAQKPDQATYRLVRHALRFLEFTANYQVALDGYLSMGKAFENHADSQLAESAAEIVAAAKRRLGLIGKPLEVSGVTVTGEPFDWSKYRGKVTLIDFWAAVSQEWGLQVLPALAGVYQKYHHEGFDIVGVNVDQDHNIAKQYLAFGELPWTVIVSENEEEQGLKNSLAVRCGVDVPPANVLVDQEGIVVGVQLRGHELEKKVAELLGKTDADAEENTATEPADTTPDEVNEPAPALGTRLNESR